MITTPPKRRGRPPKQPQGLPLSDAEAGRMEIVELKRAARAMMTEALEWIPYHAVADLKRRWGECWPWLSSDEEGSPSSCLEDTDV